MIPRVGRQLLQYGNGSLRISVSKRKQTVNSLLSHTKKVDHYFYYIYIIYNIYIIIYNILIYLFCVVIIHLSHCLLFVCLRFGHCQNAY